MKNRNVIYYSDELYHHGIQGMKWGHRNGPPYPLDPEDHSKSEQKAGWRKSLSDRREARKNYKLAKSNIKAERRNSRDRLLNDENREMLKVSKNYRAGQKISDADLEKERQIESKYNKKWTDNEAKYKNDLKNAKAAYKEELNKQKKNTKSIKEIYNGLSDNQKKAIKVGAVVAGTVLAGYAAYKVSDFMNNKKAVDAGMKAFNKVIEDRKSLESYIEKGKALRSGSNAAYYQSYQVGDQKYTWTNYREHPELIPESFRDPDNPLLESSRFEGETAEEAFDRAYNSIRRKKRK